MESKTSRYQSRILREMHQTSENPFNSPPSSTGSHGTVTLTSNITMGPQGESTRRMDDLSIKLPSQAAMRSAKTPQQTSFNVNTSALGRTFPEWSRWNPNGPEHEKDMWEITSDIPQIPDGKENVTPQGSPNSSIVATPRAGDSKEYNQIEVGKSKNASKVQTTASGRSSLRTRAQMQPQVQTESECSLDLSEPFIQNYRSREEPATRPRVPTPNAAKGAKPRGGNVTALLETLKTAQTKQAESKEQPTKQTSPASQSSAQPQNAARIHMERQSRIGNIMSPSTPNHTARSFFLPNLSYMDDFLSGALRLSALRNGIPVFVKHGRVHDRETTISPDHHADVEAIAIPEDEEKIFVSLDKIKDEIHALKEHDEQVSKQAEQLQEEVEELHIQIAKYKSRKDSAMGSDSESSIIDHLNTQKSQLEEQISSLQARLDKANRKISINEIHTESYVAERDEALKSATEHLEKIKLLQTELNTACQKLSSLRGDNTENMDKLESENLSLRNNNNSIRQQYKALLDENRSLRQHNADLSQQNAELAQDLKVAKAQSGSNKGDFQTLQREYNALSEEKKVLQQDQITVERENNKFFSQNRILKQQNSQLERRIQSLENEVARLKELLETAEAGSLPVDVIGLEQEKIRLATANERLEGYLKEVTKNFERVVRDSIHELNVHEEQRKMHEEEHASLTQQLGLTADQESALAAKLRKSAKQEAALRSELRRKADAISEARQITQEIKDFMDTVDKKDSKTTRTIDSKGKLVASETTARSTTSQGVMPIPDDYTQQIDLTQGSDFAGIYTPEMPKSRDTLRQVRTETQVNELTNELSEYEVDYMSDEASQSLPPYLSENQSRAASSHKATSGASKARSDSTKTKPVGILKDAQPSRLNALKQKTTHATVESEEFRERDRTTESVTNTRKSKSDDPVRKVSFGQPKVQTSPSKSRPVSEPELTGRFSVKSGVSGMSIDGETPKEDKFDLDSARFDLDSDSDIEENMTSAFFMDDITLEQEKSAEKQNKKTSKAGLSKDAKRVLDDLCHDHDCQDCVVCSRINSHRHEQCRPEGSSSKKTVRVEIPKAPGHQTRAKGEYEEESTLRPSMDPLQAVAYVIKTLRDEEAHLMRALREKDDEYNSHDPSVHRRAWKQISKDIIRLTKARDLKREQIYFLYDTIHIHNRQRRDMTMEVADWTINTALSKDPTWNGIIDWC
ncbi:uncharacterized protein F4822DRAFT_417904 [Hypoxylon trugodes]|uniref:uncharacterized protein n=1 Tax=Hypoxylon trugodes TaxID=326681 RepID=UPI00219EDD75|nr:uncharacterized protein F4822DRAFT_417904 [Hypoxylon trugodes]KAI1383878.1 hypothetical protein F4822DRAFT_417904 [Hypoxylon trugodes]